MDVEQNKADKWGGELSTHNAAVEAPGWLGHMVTSS
jgi:hypothetical protein